MSMLWYEGKTFEQVMKFNSDKAILNLHEDVLCLAEQRDELLAMIARLRTAAIAATDEMQKVLQSLPSTMPINYWGHPRRGRNSILDALQKVLEDTKLREETADEPTTIHD